MSRWWTTQRARMAAGAVLLATAITFILLRDLDVVIKWASVLGFFVSLCGLLLSIRAHERLPPDVGLVQRLDRATEDFAAAVQQQWRTEETMRRVQDPFPLPVQWVAAEASVTDRWVRGERPGVGLNLGGQLGLITHLFNRLPVRRLVVLGKPGAGKTVLTLRFTLDYLRQRQSLDRVPVIFPLASWNPEQRSLYAWMTERLSIDYPALGALAPSGLSWAHELVSAGRVLPVLDGLDEVPTSLRGAAMRHLNLALDHDTPVLVTCRTEEYRAAVQVAGVFTGAAVVELLPLTVGDLEEYLPRTIHHSEDDSTDPWITKWGPLLAHLRRNLDEQAAQPALEVLFNPLMTSMARVVYSDTKADPNELLRFTTPVGVEQHLLRAFIPAAYHRPTPSTAMTASPEARYHPDQAHQWLRFLAIHLDKLGTPDIGWWQQVRAVPRLSYSLWVGLSCGLLFGLVGGLAAGPIAGLAYALPLAFASGVTNSRPKQLLEPSQVEIRIRGTGKPFARRFAVGLGTGAALGLAFKLPLEMVIAVGLAFGLGFGLKVWLDRPADATRVSSPSAVLKQDRIATLAFGLSFALPFGMTYAASFLFSDDLPGTFKLPSDLAIGLGFGVAGAVAGGVAGTVIYRRIGGLAYSLVGAVIGGLVLPPAHSVVLGVGLGFLFGLAVGTLALVSRAWGAYMVGHIWLALHGRQPWRLMRFLEDAHGRGVLRQVGGVYQFRHARLQDELAAELKD
jgi:hypothetical protein